MQKAAELGKDGKVVEFLRIKKMCIADLVDVRNLPTARERQARMKSLSERHPGLQHKGAWPGSLNSYEHDHLEDPAHSGMYVPHFIALGQSEFGEDKILDIMYVPAVEDMEANAVDGGSSPLSELVDTIRGSGKYGARIEGIIDAANKKVERLMRSADRDGARLAKRLRRRARHYADNTGFELEFGVAGLKGARPRAALTPREDGLPIPMSRAGNGIQRICPMAIPGAACLGGGQAKGARGGSGRRARAHADRRARALPAPAAPGAHAALAGPPCKEVGDPGGVQHALALLCVARGDWARQAAAKGRLADWGLQDIHQAHRRGRPALTGRALARQARRAWWPCSTGCPRAG